VRPLLSHIGHVHGDGDAIAGPTFSETGMLPNGVMLDPTTGVLSGTPALGAGADLFHHVKQLSNGSGVDATQNFTLTVNEAPSFTSPLSTTFHVAHGGCSLLRPRATQRRL